MTDLKKYVVEWKKRDREFAEGFDEGYAQFKIGATLRKVREAADLSEEGNKICRAISGPAAMPLFCRWEF